MKYDDASWHYEGEFPDHLPDAAGATHIGMFLTWMLLNGFASEDLLDEADSEVAELRDRSITGPQFLIRVLDERLTAEDFSQEGNAFTVAYYKGQDDDSRYVDDYLETFGVSVETLYGVPDSWGNYDQLAARMDARYASWKLMGRPQYIV